MSVTIVSYSANGLTHYVRSKNGGALNWTEDQSAAMQFADGATADAFMDSLTSLPYVKTTVSGIVHPGKKSANQ